MIARPSWGARLGVGVTRDAVRAVLVRGGRVRWHGETPVASDEGLADAIVRLVAQAPRARLVRPRLAVVLGPSLAQLKPLAGLPPVADARLLARVVREGASRFFLVPARGLVVPDARRRSDGAVWGAALDAEAVDEVQRAAERLGLALRCIAPAVAALGHATTAASLEWRDGPHRLRLTHAGGVPSLVERLPASTDEPPAPPAVPALARLGADAWRWADAWAATTVDPRGAHVWHPALDDMRVAARHRAHLVALGIAAVAMAALAVAAPGVRATRELRAAERALARVGNRREAAARAGAELRRVTERLEHAERFRGDARSFTLMLGSLSVALPESTALLTLRVDSLEGSFLALTPRAAEVLPTLVGLPFVRDPRIVGSVTREMVAGARLERASVRFKLPRREAARRAAPLPEPRR